MLLELLKNYADIINGTTRMTQRSATAMARTMLIQAGMEPAADMVTKLSEQMIAAQEAQYEVMRRMLQSEVDMTVDRMSARPAGRSATEEQPEAEVTTIEPADLSVVETPAREPEPDSEPKVTAAPEPSPKIAAIPEPTGEANPTAAEPKAVVAPSAPAKKAPAKKTPAKRAPARRTTARKTTKAAAAKEAPTKSTTSATKRPAATPKPASNSGTAGKTEPTA